MHVFRTELYCDPEMPKEFMSTVFAMRRDTQDVMVLEEVLFCNEYSLPDEFSPEDVIVDIGAHIGVFAHACMIRGAGRVVSYEPNPENFRFLVLNTYRWEGKVECHPKAVWGRTQKLVMLDTNEYTAMYFCSDSLPNPDIDAVAMREVLTPLDRVRLVKIDAEGAEYAIFAAARPEDWQGVEEVTGELHLGRVPDSLTEDPADWLAGRLHYLGFSEVSLEENRVGPDALIKKFTARRA